MNMAVNCLSFGTRGTTLVKEAYRGAYRVSQAQTVTISPKLSPIDFLRHFENLLNRGRIRSIPKKYAEMYNKAIMLTEKKPIPSLKDLLLKPKTKAITI